MTALSKKYHNRSGIKCQYLNNGLEFEVKFGMKPYLITTNVCAKNQSILGGGYITVSFGMELPYTYSQHLLSQTFTGYNNLFDIVNV